MTTKTPYKFKTKNPVLNEYLNKYYSKIRDGAYKDGFPLPKVPYFYIADMEGSCAVDIICDLPKSKFEFEAGVFGLLHKIAQNYGFSQNHRALPSKLVVDIPNQKKYDHLHEFFQKLGFEKTGEWKSRMGRYTVTGYQSILL